MKITTAIVTLLIAAGGVSAQLLPPSSIPARSLSGQFTVFDAPAPMFRPTLQGATGADWVSLDPTLVAISAERIKQAVWRELGVTGSWRNQVFITLQPAFFVDQPVKLVADHSLGAWNYRVTMPDRITRERFLHAMVQVVLTELANRNAREQTVEIPPWLLEGMTRQLLSGHGPDLVLNTPRLNMNGVTYNPATTTDFHPVSQLEKAHKTLVGETPLTFEELCWPAPGQIEGSEGPSYRACAQVFTDGLLKLPGGKDCMREFIAALPSYLNWQMAFLQGFKPHFTRPLDVEKWWALQSTGFAGRDIIQTWKYEESWNKLADALIARVDVFRSTNELPVRAELKLQTIVREWDAAKQEAVLHGKVEELETLHFRIAPELAGLTLEYSEALATYLNQLNASAVRVQRAPVAPSQVIRGRRDVLKRLDTLDARIEKMRPGSLAAGGPTRGAR